MPEEFTDVTPLPSVRVFWLRDNHGKKVVLHYFDGMTVSGALVDSDAECVSLLSYSDSGKAFPIVASLSDVRHIMAVE